MAKAKTPANTTTANTSRVRNSGSFRDFERNNADVGRGELLKVPLTRIHVQPGFNPRNLSKPETQAKIQEIKEAYKSGIFVPAILVRLESNEAVTIVDGECRFTAAGQADAELKAEGKDGISHLMCVPFKGDAFECKMMTVSANKGEQLTVLELAGLIADTIAELKIPKSHIAKRSGWSASYIDKLEAISKLPQAIKDMVQADRISIDVALDKFKKHGADAVEVLQAIIDKADGKKVTTAKAKAIDAEPSGDDGDEGDAPASTPAAKKANPKKVVAAAQALAYALPEIDQDIDNIKDTKTYTLKVSGAAMKAMIDLQNQFPDQEPEAEADDEPEPEAQANGAWPFQVKDKEAANVRTV